MGPRRPAAGRQRLRALALALLYLGVLAPAMASLAGNASREDANMDATDRLMVTDGWAMASRLPNPGAPTVASPPEPAGATAPPPGVASAPSTPVPPPAPATATAGHPPPGYRASPSSSPGCPAVIYDVFGEAAPEACAISYCETGGTYDPMALGDAGTSYGLFQLHTGWHGPRGPHGWASWYGVEPEDLFDPLINTLVARAIYDYLGGRFGGPGGWTCARIIGIN